MTKTEEAVHENKIIEDIKIHPEFHRHTYPSLVACCSWRGSNGSVVLCQRLVEAHAGVLGKNGGVECDVTEGPCACGAWHCIL